MSAVSSRPPVMAPGRPGVDSADIVPTAGDRGSMRVAATIGRDVRPLGQEHPSEVDALAGVSPDGGARAGLETADIGLRGVGHGERRMSTRVSAGNCSRGSPTVERRSRGLPEGAGLLALREVAHRGESSLVRLCGTCGVAAEGACERCGLPVCHAHRPGADRRCFECEAAYRRRRPGRILFYLASLVSASVALVVALFFLVVATGGGALGVAPLILFGSFPVILHWLEHRARAHFLAERRSAVALPPARLVR